MIRTILTGALTVVLLLSAETVPAQGPRPKLPPIEALNLPMPDLGQLKTWVNGPPLTAKEVRGKVLVAYFWTIEQNMSENNWKHVEAWMKRYPNNKDVVFLPIHKFQYDSKTYQDEETIAGVKKKKFLSALDFDDRVANAWKCRSTPTIYLVDRSGQIRYRWEGPMDGPRNLHMEGALRSKIEELRAEKPPE